MTDLELLQYARQYAIEHHKNTYGGKPYAFHLDQVYDLAVKFNLGIEYQIASYLHDIVEDTPVTKDMLIPVFGHHIATMVYCVSGFGENRKERQENIKEKMKNYPASINLKMIDRLANMINSKLDNPKLYKMYCKEHIELAPIFSQGNMDIFNEIVKLVESGMENNTKQNPVVTQKKSRF